MPARVAAMVKTVGNLLQADVGPFDRPRRMLAEAVDQPLPVRGDEGVVDGGAAEIDASCDSHVREYITRSTLVRALFAVTLHS